MLLIRTSLALLLLAAATPSAFAAQPDEAPRPRTGADAEPPPRPPFPAPAPPPLLPGQTEAAPTAPPSPGAAIREIRVVERSAGLDALLPEDWRPGEDPLSGLRIDHEPGERLDADWVRRQFTINEVRDAARAIALTQLINRAFLGAGFVNSGLLVQPESQPGVLVLDLVHGRVAAPAGGQAVEVRWTGGDALGLRPSYIRDRMPSARRQPVNAALIERDFRLLAEDPAIRTVNAQLRPGDRPGEASLLLSVLPAERTDFYLTAGNSRSPAVGGERYAAGLRIRNFFASGDSLYAETGFTEGGVDVAAGFSAPIIDAFTILNLRASYNEAAVIDTALLPLDIRARERTLEASVLRTVLRTPLTPAGDGVWAPSQTLTLGIGYASRRQQSSLLGFPFSFAPGSVDGRAEYGAIRLLGDYVLRNVDQVFAASVTATVGVAGTRSTEPGLINPDRNFLALLVQLNFARRLSAGGLELRTRLTGQVASSVLYSGERLSVGGEATVRGYRETLLLTDEGVIGSVELAQPFSLSGSSGGTRRFDWGAFTIAGFVDGAFARNQTLVQPVPDSIASAGAALTWQPSDALQLRLSYGYALTDAVPSGSTDLQDHGVHIRLTIRPLRLFAHY